MKIAIYGQFYQEEASEYIKILLDILALKKINVVIEKHFYKRMKMHLPNALKYATFDSYYDLNNSFDTMLTIGGDGTMLRAATFVRDLDIPLLGINTGRLGFLSTISKNHIPEAILMLLSKKYTIKERTLLSVFTNPENKELALLNFALNEITVSRKNTTSMIIVETHLNNEYLTSYWADGLIVSTPTGSTGYSLSCGGPVIVPETSNLVLTPIAPHNLNARPLVIPDDTEIKLNISGREKDILISLDSRITTLNSKTEITIKKTPFTIKMIEINNQTFLKTLREKLLWGQDTRN